MRGPTSSYPTIGGLASGWEVELIHMRPKVDREARMEPPSHTVIIRSGGAMTLTLAPSATRPSISAWRRSGMLGNMVVPPDMTMLHRRSLRTSRSQSSAVFLASSCRHHLLTIHGWLEHELWAPDDLVVHSDNRHVRKLEGILL